LKPAPASNDVYDAFGRFVGTLMRPDANDTPTRGTQASIGIRVSGAVGLDFVTPKLRVALWPGGVLRATVPEAAIDEDGDSGAGKNDIGDPPRLVQQRDV
jgi:hypothetical protein